MQLIIDPVPAALCQNLHHWGGLPSSNSNMIMYLGNIRGQAALAVEYTSVGWEGTGQAVPLWFSYYIGESDVNRTHMCRIADEHVPALAELLTFREGSMVITYCNTPSGFTVSHVDDNDVESEPSRGFKAVTIPRFDLPLEISQKDIEPDHDVRFNDQYAQLRLTSCPGGSLTVELPCPASKTGFYKTVNEFQRQEVFKIPNEELQFTPVKKESQESMETVEAPPSNIPGPVGADLVPPTGKVEQALAPTPAVPAPPITPAAVEPPPPPPETAPEEAAVSGVEPGIAEAQAAQAEQAEAAKPTTKKGRPKKTAPPK